MIKLIITEKDGEEHESIHLTKEHAKGDLFQYVKEFWEEELGEKPPIAVEYGDVNFYMFKSGEKYRFAAATKEEHQQFITKIVA